MANTLIINIIKSFRLHIRHTFSPLTDKCRTNLKTNKKSASFPRHLRHAATVLLMVVWTGVCHGQTNPIVAFNNNTESGSSEVKIQNQ